VEKLKSKLKANGIELTMEQDSVVLQPIKKSQLKYILIALLSIPTLMIVLIFTGLSIIGVILLATSISLLYNGIKSRNEVVEFNSYNIRFNKTHMIAKEKKINYSDFKKFKAGLSTNLFFPNINIEVQTNESNINVLAIWNKNKKYLNEDKYDIVNGLNDLVTELTSLNK